MRLFYFAFDNFLASLATSHADFLAVSQQSKGQTSLSTAIPTQNVHPLSKLAIFKPIQPKKPLAICPLLCYEAGKIWQDPPLAAPPESDQIKKILCRNIAASVPPAPLAQNAT